MRTGTDRRRSRPTARDGEHIWRSLRPQPIRRHRLKMHGRRRVAGTRRLLISLRKQTAEKGQTASGRRRRVWNGTHGSRVDSNGWSARSAAHSPRWVRTTVGERHHEGVKRWRGSQDIISSVCIETNLKVALVRPCKKGCATAEST